MEALACTPAICPVIRRHMAVFDCPRKWHFNFFKMLLSVLANLRLDPYERMGFQKGNIGSFEYIGDFYLHEFWRFAVGYQVKGDFTVGLTAYSFNQFTDDNLHGRTLHGLQSQVFALGPGIHFSAFGKNFFSINASFEVGARNMSEGRPVRSRVGSRL
jgi:hypothetical protein